MGKITKIEDINDSRVRIYYNRKKYCGIFDKDYGWNFWEEKSNDLADEMSSYNGDIHDLNKLTDYFENNILI